MKGREALLALTVILSVLVIGSQSYAQTQKPAEVKKGNPAKDLAAIDHLLTTTRTVRKRLDLTRPVDPKIIEEAIEIATGSYRVECPGLALCRGHRSRKEKGNR